MNSFVINPAETEWNNFIKTQKDATIFHSNEWKNVIKKTFRYEPFYLISKNDEDKIEAVLPIFKIKSLLTSRRFVSVPFSAAAGCIGDEKFNYKFVKHIDERFDLSGYDYLLIRTDKTIKLNEIECTLRTHSADFYLELNKDMDELWKSFPARVKTAVRKAEKEGVKLKAINDSNGVNSFYDLMLLNNKKYGIPPFSISLYKNILNEFQNANIFFADLNGQKISSIMFVEWNGCYYYLYAASDYNYSSKNGNDFLVWEMIKSAYKENVRIINLGRSDLEQKTMVSFKEKWGAQRRQLYFYYIPKMSKVTNRSGRLYNIISKIFNILPTFFTKLIGPVISHRLG